MSTNWRKVWAARARRPFNYKVRCFVCDDVCNGHETITIGEDEWCRHCVEGHMHCDLS